jgi:opacity protein-like surface antigen
MKKITAYFFISMLAILCAVYPFQTASAHSGGYFGILGGYTINPDLRSRYYDHWFFYEDDIHLDIEESPFLGVKIGYTHPQARALGLELEYSYLNPDITNSVDIDSNVKLNNFMFNIYTKIPTGIIHPYWGFGLGLCKSDMSEQATAWFGGKDATSFAWQLLTGVEIDMANNLAVDIGYRYFVTELEFKNDMEYEHGNSRDVDFTSSMVTLSFKFFF